MNIHYSIRLAGVLCAAFIFSTCHPWQWGDLPLVNPPCASIISLSSNSGSAGDVITVFGAGFDAQNIGQFKLTIHGTEVAILDMRDSTSFLFAVPEGVGSGEIALSREGSNCVAIAPQDFTYLYTGSKTTVFATQLSFPVGLDVDANGNVFVANKNAHNIKMFPKTGGSGTVIAGNPQGNYGWVDHPNGTSARFTFPTDVALGVSGVIYVADEGNNAIRKIDGDGTSREVTTIVGGPNLGGDNNFGEVNYADVRLTSPSCIATDRQNKLYFTEPALRNIRVIDENAKKVRKIQVMAPLVLSYPNGVAYSIANGDEFPVYICDQENDYLLGINPVTGSNQSIPSTKIFSTPTDVVLDDDGLMYVLDRDKFKVFIVYPEGNYISVPIASSTVNPNAPAGLALDKQNKILYISDEALNMIYKIELK